ncbi:hypothetical protein ACWKW6_07595 [Dyadobacter jiangsuensis]
MTLIQKLPLGLALAACMMMSSCSQEDVQVAGPEAYKAVTLSKLKVASTPVIETTNGPAGNNVFASGWLKLVTFIPDNLKWFAAGTSSLTHLWGNQSLPWFKPLAPPAQNATGIITFTQQKNFVVANGTMSQVYTYIKNLTPGKKYAVKVYGATTIAALNGKTTQYGNGIMFQLEGTTDPGFHVEIDLQQKQAEWVGKTIVFEALQDQVLVRISPNSSNSYFQSTPKFYHFLHVFVGSDAIKEL